MRDLTSLTDKRIQVEQLSLDGGFFVIASPIDQARMAVIASYGLEWDHVSVSRKNRVPNWAEMEHVKRLFFADDEVAVQYTCRPRITSIHTIFACIYGVRRCSKCRARRL
jgi:hypothetical protein